MRILGHIDHPALKITVFKMDNRISVKFENALYEQTYKLGTDDRFATLEAIREWLDPPLMAEIQNLFTHMHQTRLSAVNRQFNNTDGDSPFPEII